MRIVILEGDGAINSVRSRRAATVSVVVENAQGSPLPGASVTFTAPMTGASGVFSNGSRSTVVVTDSSGKAHTVLKPNNVAGSVELRLIASHHGSTARAAVSQVNMDVPGNTGGGSGKLIAILAIVSGAAAGGALAYTQLRNKDPRSGPPVTAATPVVITPGVGVAGPPF